MNKLRLLIIDDHPLMRRALKTAVIAEPDIEVAGMAADGLEAQRVIAETEPDLILVDLLMPFGGGDTYLPPEITTLLVASIQQEARVKKTAVSTVSMTPREQDIFAQLGYGLTNAEIAEELSISEATVRVHLHNIINKYNFTSRSQAVAVAIRHQLDHD